MVPVAELIDFSWLPRRRREMEFLLRVTLPGRRRRLLSPWREVRSALYLGRGTVPRVAISSRS